MIIKKEKYKAAVVLTIIGWVFLVVFLGVLIYCLCNIHVFQEDNSIAYAFLLPVIFEVCFIVSFFLNKSYRKANKKEGIKVSKLCTFIYILTIIGMLPLLPWLLAYGLFVLALGLISKFLNKFQGSTSSNIKVKDEKGNEHTLRHGTGRNYQDEDGNWWTQDYFDSNKFNKD